ncbi:hypothetical protein BU15DRAFT_83202 [Melanogaster broomeanus]|nr:hypothetical protein BU15DRAFT_83202 [Melanogaster broomeanus]
MDMTELIWIVVMNTIIQASVALGDLPHAVGTYKSFSDYDCKPNVDTFNLLFAGCVAAKHRELGNKLLLDLTKADAQPNATTFEQIILLCLTQPTYEDAFFYIEEMKAEKFIPSAKIYEAVIRTCVAAGDSRYSLASQKWDGAAMRPRPVYDKSSRNTIHQFCRRDHQEYDKILICA